MSFYDVNNFLNSNIFSSKDNSIFKEQDKEKEIDDINKDKDIYNDTNLNIFNNNKNNQSNELHINFDTINSNLINKNLKGFFNLETEILTLKSD